MKAFKSAEEFGAALDRALAEHEKRQLTHVSLPLIKKACNGKKEMK